MNEKIIKESDFKDFLSRIINNKSLLFKTFFISISLGVIFSYLISNKYTSSTVFIPQLSSESNISSSSSSSLSGLASIAGINLNSMETSNSIPASLYPQIVSSINYKLELLDKRINYKNNNIKIRDYLLEKRNKSFDFIFKLFRKKNPDNINSDFYSVTEDDYYLFNLLSKRLNLSINMKEGFINLSFTDENKFNSAIITDLAQKILERRIIDYKIKASKELLDFSLEQYNLKLSSFNDLQEKRANFEDQNLNISSSLYQIQLERLKAELAISQNVVKELANQVEKAKLQVSKDTPVITIISSVSIPFQKSSPNRKAVLGLFIFIGLSISLFYIFFKKSFQNIF